MIFLITVVVFCLLCIACAMAFLTVIPLIIAAIGLFFCWIGGKIHAIYTLRKSNIWDHCRH